MSSAMVSECRCGPGRFGLGPGSAWPLVGRGAAPALLAECIGTCILVLTIIGTVIAASLARPVAGLPYGSLAVPLAAGVALTSLVAALGPISGAHLNPALTVGLAINGRFGWARVAPYVAVPALWSVVAALIAWELYGSRARSVVNLGATYPARGVGVGQALIAESDRDVRSRVDRGVRRVGSQRCDWVVGHRNWFCLGGSNFRQWARQRRGGESGSGT